MNQENRIAQIAIESIDPYTTRCVFDRPLLNDVDSYSVDLLNYDGTTRPTEETEILHELVTVLSTGTNKAYKSVAVNPSDILEISHDSGTTKVVVGMMVAATLHRLNYVAQITTKELSD